MQLGVSEILDRVSKLTKNDEIVNALRQNSCPALLTMLQGAFDSRIKWLLPPGNPPYKPNEAPDTHNVLHAQIRKMYLFIEGGNPGLKQIRREQLFIELLEQVHPRDALVLLACKEKQAPCPNITKQIVFQAFPGLVE